MTEADMVLLIHQFLLYLEDLQRYDKLARFLLPPMSRERMIKSFLQYKQFMDEVTNAEHTALGK